MSESFENTQVKISTAPYIGKCSYCYANSTAMLLSTIGENVSPSLIEVLTGVGLSAFLQKGKRIIFFSTLSGMPDRGISKALEILGFSYTERVRQKEEPVPFEELRKKLAKSPAILGPLDMGYLIYNPDYKYLGGADHYVLAYNMNDKEIYLHDPEGFPHVSLPLNQLALAWKAKRIFYRRGFCHYWTSPRRIRYPTEREIYKMALLYFKSLYRESTKKAARENRIVGREAILTLADHVQNRKLSPQEIDHLTHFALKLGAKRALDFASFFDFHDSGLADLKRKQAELFGKCHALAVAKNWSSLSKNLQKLAEIEEEFRIKLVSNH